MVRAVRSTALPFCAVQWDNICNWQPFTARSVLLPPPLWKDPTCCPVGSVIPSSHKGHICEWCLLGFHTKEPQQASINGLQAAELCSNVPTLCPLDGWVHKEKTPVPGPPAVHVIGVYPIYFSTIPLMFSSNAGSLFYLPLGLQLPQYNCNLPDTHVTQDHQQTFYCKEAFCYEGQKTIHSEVSEVSKATETSCQEKRKPKCCWL